MVSHVATCSSCSRRTPVRLGRCVYCSHPLPGSADDQAASQHAEPRTLGGKPRFVPQSDDRVHVLLGDTAEPVRLDPGKLFVMGRDPHTSLTITVGDVSRQHAEIDWQGDPPRPVLAEVRSSTGTFLNEKPVLRGQPEPLRSGDDIRLGTRTVLRYLHLTERELEKVIEERARKETRHFDPKQILSGLDDGQVQLGGGGSAAAPAGAIPLASAPDAPAAAPAPASAPAPGPVAAAPPAGPRRGEDLDALVSSVMGESGPPSTLEAGSFLEIPPADLLSALHGDRRSGILTVFLEGMSGELVLIEGRCKEALLGLYRDREVVEIMAGLEGGCYRFRDGSPEELSLLPPLADVDEQGLSLGGEFSAGLTAADLVREFKDMQVRGVLTICDEKRTGEVVFDAGTCTDVGFGRLGGRDAMAEIVRLAGGYYRFRPALDPERAAQVREQPGRDRRRGPTTKPWDRSGRQPSQSARARAGRTTDEIPRPAALSETRSTGMRPVSPGKSGAIPRPSSERVRRQAPPQQPATRPLPGRGTAPVRRSGVMRPPPGVRRSGVMRPPPGVRRSGVMRPPPTGRAQRPSTSPLKPSSDEDLEKPPLRD